MTAASHEDVNAAEAIEPSCDVQRIFQMKNYVHMDSLPCEFYCGRDWDKVGGLLSQAIDYCSEFGLGPGGLAVSVSRARFFFSVFGTTRWPVAIRIASESSFSVIRLYPRRNQCITSSWLIGSATWTDSNMASKPSVL